MSGNAGNVPGGDLPSYPLDRSSIPGALPDPVISLGIEWRRAFWFCALAALLSIAVTSLRLINPLVAVLSAGFLAVVLYYRRKPVFIATAGSGAKIGAVTGLLFSGVLAVFFAIFLVMLQSGGEIRQQLLDAFQQLASRSNDPQVQVFLELLKTPEGLNKLTLATVGFFLISIAAGGVAGALTGAFLGRRNRL